MQDHSTMPEFVPPWNNYEVRELNATLIPAGYKWCSACRRALPLSEFGANSSAKWGYSTQCRECIGRAASFDKDAKRARARMNNYGIGPDAHAQLLASQGGVCAICGKLPRKEHGRGSLLHVDHDHKTGVVRGLLCVSCNTGLGRFDDDAEILRRAADYVSRTSV